MSNVRRSRMAAAAIVAALSAACASSSGPGQSQAPGQSAGRSPSPAPTPAPARLESAESRLAAIKTQVMSADYRADLAQLRQLRGQAAQFGDDPRMGYLAHYWAGFASWRIAINGANAGMPDADLAANLDQAAVDFAAAARLRDDFADAWAAGSMVHGWLVKLTLSDLAVARPHLDTAMQLSARAKALAPDNPRVLWMQASELLFLPPARGGNPKRAIEVYRQMAAASPATPSTTSPLPDWGKPEALMSLAWAHQNQTPPDLAAATAEAQEALRLVPDWHYVRDILLPMIAARAKPAS